jgi:hypothetical protein
MLSNYCFPSERRQFLHVLVELCLWQGAEATSNKRENEQEQYA